MPKRRKKTAAQTVRKNLRKSKQEMKKLTAAGGVLFKPGIEGPLVLLIYRREVWDLPKGKLEANESIRACAKREVSEEVGCKLPHIHAKLAETFHEYTRDDVLFGKTTHWFAMTLNGDGEHLKPERQEGIERLQWFPLPEAQVKVGYKNLVTVLEKFRKWYVQDK